MTTFAQRYGQSASRAACAVCLAFVWGCRPSDVLSVPLPAGTVGSGSLQNQAGAESAFSGAKAVFFNAVAGSSYFIQWATVLSDENNWSNFTNEAGAAGIDARITHGGGGYQEEADSPLILLLSSRSSLLVVIPALKKFEPDAQRWKVGEAYALVGYIETLIAEGYCAGVPLDQIVSNGGVELTSPLTTDSLMAIAESHFDSALTNATGSDSIRELADVGLARVRIDRGKWQTAATAVSNVKTNFVYNTELEPTLSTGSSSGPNLYANEFQSACGFFSIADRKGGNGINYVSANDPRLVIDSTSFNTCDGGTWYYPAKFGTSNQSTVPLATGIEARLIEAEASLQLPNTSQWATQLNALRADSANTGVTGLPSISPDSTTIASTSEQVDVMFRERAMWLFGTGTRLGDMRRLIRQYGRASNSVYPTGPYPNGQNSALPSPIASYGNDVDFTLPTAASGLNTPNTAFRGCLAPTTTP